MTEAFNKILSTIGLGNNEEVDEEVENVYDYNYEKTEETDEPEVKSFFGKRAKVVNMPQTHQIRMNIVF